MMREVLSLRRNVNSIRTQVDKRFNMATELSFMRQHISRLNLPTRQSKTNLDLNQVTSNGKEC